MNPHPQRCETCDFTKEQFGIRYCMKVKRALDVATIRFVGCASHSTAVSEQPGNCDYCTRCIESERKSEREMVLDELNRWLDEREQTRLSDSKGRSEDHEFINELYAQRYIDVGFRKRIEQLRKGEQE